MEISRLVDPYTPEEREEILEAFLRKRPHYYRFVFFQFWQGTRPSEAIALTRGDVDLRYATARITKSIVQGHKGGTKTVRSNREIHLHENVMKVLTEENPAPLNVDPDDFLFSTPEGTAIDESNFYNREWKPMLRRLKNIRTRPFYNTRHSYVSFLYSIGARSGFISSQTGDSIKTLEADYAKYIKDADDNREFVEKQIEKSATLVKPASDVEHSPAPLEKKKAPEKSEA